MAVHRAFVMVYLQFHFPLKKSAHRGHHPITAALRGNGDVAVVRVTAKGVPFCAHHRGSFGMLSMMSWAMA